MKGKVLNLQSFEGRVKVDTIGPVRTLTTAFKMLGPKAARGE